MTGSTPISVMRFLISSLFIEMACSDLLLARWVSYCRNLRAASALR
jgi:hypothetical protein